MRGAWPGYVVSNLKEAAIIIIGLLTRSIEANDEHPRSGALKLLAVPTAAR